MNSKIALISTVINKELYAKSSQLFPQNIQKYIIEGTNGMHGLDSLFYMMKKLKGRGVEWLIMADEDVLFENPNLVFDIINKMESKNYSVCGIRDGGLISHRVQNPYLINTFFSIINFKEIELIWDKKEVIRNNYIEDNEFDDDLSSLKGLFDKKSLKEPYYCFFLWLRRNEKKILFLDSCMAFENDEFTNKVFFENHLLLFHTWHARFYGKNEKHTIRINSILNLLKFEDSICDRPIYFKNQFYFFRQKVIKKINQINLKIKAFKDLVTNY